MEIDEVMESIRASVIRDAGRIDPSITAQVEADRHEIEEHERRLTQRPAPPPPKVKTQVELDAEKQEREIQTRVRQALADLEAERAAATEE